MAKQCQACGGIYQRRGPDGLTYFHRCPPIVTVRVRRAGLVQRVPLGELQATDEIRVRREGQELWLVVSLVQPGDLRLGDRMTDRANVRDERPRRDRESDAKGEQRIEALALAPGAGILEVPEPAEE